MLDSLIKSTILLLAVTLACHLLRRRSASLRHLLWTLSIVGLVALPILTAFPPFRLNVLPAFATPAPERLAATDASPLVPARDLPVAGDAGDAGAPVTPRAAATSSPEIADAHQSFFTLARVLLIVWGVGALLLLARFVASLVVVGRIARGTRDITEESWHVMSDRAARALGVASPPDLRESDDVAMPFACGLARPMIVLPTSATEWTTEHREAVLMHEMAHISRGDLAMNMLSHVVRALYWFHPLAWLAAYRIRVEGERACDDAVLRAGALPSSYAEHLLNIVRSVGRTVPSVALAMARRSDFEGRLLAILEPGTSRAQLGRVRVAGIAAAFALVIMPLAAVAPARAAVMTASSVQESDSAAAPQAPSSTISALIETLDDGNAAVRMAAVRSLAQLQDPRAITALAKAMREDADPRVREAAAYALGEIDDSRAVPALLDALKSERVASVREKIVHALGEIDDPTAVSGISGATKDASVKVRREVAWALGELEDPAAASALMGMARDDDADVRRRVAEALGDLKSTGAMDVLVAMTRDSDSDVRAHAINALGNLEDQRALGALVAALKDPVADVRAQAADAIHNLEDMKKAPAELIAALNDPNREVRKNVAHALGSIEDPAAVPGLKRLTGDTDTEVRRAAAEALKDIGGPEAIQALLALLKDPDPEIRKTAAEALGSKRQ